ncbi:hypothetical protein ACFY9C_32570 [Streptomyces filamentosus]|uniref:hypothetical protein n=1 Tax=Streptomyces filamentosus TaxID=67294 RepID=UPI0036EBBBCF
MSALPRVAATLLIASLALLGGAATASAHSSAPVGDGIEVELEETYVVVFGPMFGD